MMQLNKRILGALCLTFLLLTLVACGSQEDTPPVSRGILYEVEGGNTGVYLFGSVHIGHEDMYPLHDSVKEALERSDVIGLEIDFSPMTEEQIALEMLEYGLLTDGRQMTDIISQELFDEIVEITSPLGVPGPVLNHFRPWYAGLILNEVLINNTRYSTEYGVENYLLTEYGDKETISLETFAHQFAPYQLLSNESQAIYLKDMLDEMEEAEEDLDEMIAHWREGDVEAFAELREKILEEAETESLKRFHEASLDERDRQMAEVIAGILESDDERTYFITVGTLHLVGENSIVERLSQMGFEVRLVQ